MLDEETLRKELLVGFEYSCKHDDWITPLDEALEGLTPEQAQWRPTPDAKSIWEIVLHLAVWNENIVERVRTGRKAGPTEGAWPPLPSALNEHSWDESKSRLWIALDSVRTMIETTPIDTIQASPYGLGDLVCRLTHNGYHLGQIEKLRQWMDSVDPTGAVR